MGKYNKALRDAKEQLLHICDTKEESLREVHRYKEAFPRETDYNIAQYGNVLIYYDQIRQWFKKFDFKSVDKVSNSIVWHWYKWYIGRAADML